MEKVILNLIKLQNQIRILHWQTESFGQHKAFGKTYEVLDALMDKLVEVYQGKYGRIAFGALVSIELMDMKEMDVSLVLKEVTNYMSTSFVSSVDPETDTDILNIRDEMLAELNKLKYLLTLK